MFLFQFTSLNHYSMFALEGRGGELRWKLTPFDYQFNPAYLIVSDVGMYLVVMVAFFCFLPAGCLYFPTFEIGDE